MSQDDLAARGRSLEDAFFRAENEKLRVALRAEAEAGASDGGDAPVFAHLRELDVAGDTAEALTLIPIVAIAWADGVLHARERAALTEAATAAGIAPDSASGALLQSWLDQRPDPELFERWKSFIVALCVDRDVHAVERLRSELLSRARTVAEAAGGFLGVGRVSARESEILDEMEHAFPA